MADGDFLSTLRNIDPPLTRLVLGGYNTVGTTIEGEIIEIGLDFQQGCCPAVVVFLQSTFEVGGLVVLLILEISYHQIVLSRHCHRYKGEEAKE